MYNDVTTIYYLPSRRSTKLSCQDYNTKLAFGFNATGTPYILTNNNTGVMLTGPVTLTQTVVDASTNHTGAATVTGWALHSAGAPLGLHTVRAVTSTQ